MKKSAVLGLALLCSSSVFAQTVPPHWQYSQPEGPSEWGNLPGYSTCAVGAGQSPIDIEDGSNAGLINVTRDTSLPAVDTNWSASNFNMVNNGHTLQVNYDAGSEVTFAGQTLPLKQFHFHSPSEHIMNGREYPLEMHFVHQNSVGATTVVGVFFEMGEPNTTLDMIWANAPVPGQASTVQGLTVNANDFLPKGMEFYNYTGSLTTPPCTEAVNWIVLKTPITASKTQLQFLQKKMGGPNNRPIQPLDGRMIGTADL